MVNYQQGKIYKITSLQTDKIYIGSTCKKTLAERISQHKYTLKQWKAGKPQYISSIELLDKYDDCCIILLENYPCNSKDELGARERYYIELYKDICVNIMIPTRTNKEYVKENKEIIKKYKKEYYEQNKEKINNKNLEWRNNHKEETKIYMKNYYQQKKYRENNKDLE